MPIRIDPHPGFCSVIYFKAAYRGRATATGPRFKSGGGFSFESVYSQTVEEGD